jgi:hypothetical protein
MMMSTAGLRKADLRHLESLWSGPLGEAFAAFRALAEPSVALAAALVETGIGLHGLGRGVPSPGDLLVGDLCLARASRLLADHAPSRVQIAFSDAIERVAAAAAGGDAPAPVRGLLVAALEAGT